MGANFRQDLHAAFVGQHHIQNDDIGHDLRGHGGGILTVAMGHNAPALPLEQEGQGFYYVRLIFDQQHRSGHCSLPRPIDLPSIKPSGWRWQGIVCITVQDRI